MHEATSISGMVHHNNAFKSCTYIHNDSPGNYVEVLCCCCPSTISESNTTYPIVVEDKYTIWLADGEKDTRRYVQVVFLKRNLNYK